MALESIVDVRRTRLELLLKVLDVDGAVHRVPGGWTATGEPWTYDAERYGRVTEAREREQQLMVDYERTDRCRMAFLQETLDDDSAEPCGRCDRCVEPWFDTTIPEAAVNTARSRLERPGVVLESARPVALRHGPSRRAAQGQDRALGRDGGRPSRRPPQRPRVGPASARAAPRRGPGGPGRGRASLRRRARGWGWRERPAAIVSVPSRRRPLLVGSLAAGLGQLGRLPYLGALDLVEGGPVGEPGGNSAFRLANVWGRLAVGPELGDALSGIPGPVLLLDDVSDSRWTLTVCAGLLREAGAPAVLPMALAMEA